MAVRNTTMNALASYVDDFLYHGRYNKTDIGNQLGMSRQAFYNYLRKVNFNIDDANRILNAIGYEIEFNIVPKKDWQYAIYKVQIKKSVKPLII